MNIIPERDGPLFRKDCLAINENFKQLSGYYGIQVELIDCGLEPGDSRGDTMRVAIQKMNRNFAKLASVFPGS